MAELGYYNRLDRTPFDIAKLAVEDSSRIIDSGVVLVRKTSDGSQGTYDVRHYPTKEAIPAFFNGRLFKVTLDGVEELGNHD